MKANKFRCLYCGKEVNDILVGCDCPQSKNKELWDSDLRRQQSKEKRRIKCQLQKQREKKS